MTRCSLILTLAISILLSAGSSHAQPAKVRPAPPAAALSTPAHSGRARAFEATVKQKATIYGDIPALVPGETALKAHSAGAGTPGLVTGQMFHAAVAGQMGQTHAESSVHDLELDVGEHRISASYVAGRAGVNCARNGPAVAMRAEVVNLVVDGKPVAFPSRPNQRIWWKDGYLSLNEQSGGVTGGKGTTVVVALRVVLNNGDTVSIGRAEAGLDCSGGQPCTTDFLTGSGWITSGLTGGRLNLAVALGLKADGTISGHLVLEDARASMRFSAQGADTFVVGANGGVRQISGEGVFNGRAGMKYRLEILDGGDRTGADRVMAFLANGYMAVGYLQAGNIHLMPCR